MTIEEKEQAIIDEFSLFEDWMDKYSHLIDQAKSLPNIDESYKTDEHLVKGCQSQVWLNAELNGGLVHYTADSDAAISKGIMALLIRVLSNETPEAILRAELSFLDTIGLKEHLSSNRANGLSAMLKLMKAYALGFQIKSKQ